MDNHFYIDLLIIGDHIRIVAKIVFLEFTKQVFFFSKYNHNHLKAKLSLLYILRNLKEYNYFKSLNLLSLCKFHSNCFWPLHQYILNISNEIMS